MRRKFFIKNKGSPPPYPLEITLDLLPLSNSFFPLLIFNWMFSCVYNIKILIEKPNFNLFVLLLKNQIVSNRSTGTGVWNLYFFRKPVVYSNKPIFEKFESTWQGKQLVFIFIVTIFIRIFRVTSVSTCSLAPLWRSPLLSLIFD
jgi:hypothetical protein